MGYEIEQLSIQREYADYALWDRELKLKIEGLLQTIDILPKIPYSFR